MQAGGAEQRKAHGSLRGGAPPPLNQLSVGGHNPCTTDTIWRVLEPRPDVLR
jgi:hypothetical protein